MRPDRALLNRVRQLVRKKMMASGGVGSDTAVLVTDSSRQFIASTGNAGGMLGRPSLVGLRVDDDEARLVFNLRPVL